MKRIIATLAIALAATVALAAPTQADEWGPWNITDPADVCVRADFAITGSGWKVHKTVDNWNSVQSVVHFRVGYTPDCADILLHLYTDTSDGVCGATGFDRLWATAYQENGVVFFSGADVYLNQNCSTRKVTRKWVLAHELGHAIGLIHVTGVDDSVMSPTYNATLYKGVPGASDVATVDALYAPRT